MPNFFSRICWTPDAFCPVSPSEICRPLPPSSLSPWTFWISGFLKPAAWSASEICVSDGLPVANATLARVPDSKSMPKFRPLPPMASAPMSRITPDTEKNHFDAPMKSWVQRRLRSPAPSAFGCVMIGERCIVPRTAWVASTAVNSEVSVPMPNVKAKPLTPAVARMKRMKATMNVTTFASMIAAMPFL